MKDQLLYSTIVISLIAQVLTGVIDVYALTLNYTGDKRLIKGLICVELFVQIIEMIFYVWLVVFFTKATNVTQKRYYDWIVTTPSMLYIFIVYLDFLRNGNSVPELNEDETTWQYLVHAFMKNSNALSIILPLNLFVLIFGYLGELHIIDKYTSVTWGFIPFVLYFYYIYEHYAKYTNPGLILWSIFVGIWSLYGISALLPYISKNVMYNFLDIVSKNFFGVFLAVIAIMNTD
jgi:hypothetical protein